MFDDSRLKSLQKELGSLITEQSSIMVDIQNTRSVMESKIKRLENDYGNDISRLERKYETAKRRIPDVTRQIENRQSELAKELASELKNSAANSNNVSGTARRSGWLS